MLPKQTHARVRRERRSKGIVLYSCGYCRRNPSRFDPSFPENPRRHYKSPTTARRPQKAKEMVSKGFCSASPETIRTNPERKNDDAKQTPLCAVQGGPILKKPEETISGAEREEGRGYVASCREDAAMKAVTTLPRGTE